MAGALLRRIFSSLGVLFGVSLLNIILARVIPGDPARIALGPMASPEQVEALRRELYLDRPLPLQYLEFLRRLARGDLGISTYSKRPVVEDLKEYLPATLERCWGGTRTRPGRWSGASASSKTPCSSPQAPF